MSERGRPGVLGGTSFVELCSEDQLYTRSYTIVRAIDGKGADHNFRIFSYSYRKHLGFVLASGMLVNEMCFGLYYQVAN